jgi:hypothetical protein
VQGGGDEWRVQGTHRVCHLTDEYPDVCNESTDLLHILAYVVVVTMMMIMSMGSDYVSELRPPTGLLVIPRVIYERGEPWWNANADRTKLVTRAPELSGNATTRDIC